MSSMLMFAGCGQSYAKASPTSPSLASVAAPPSAAFPIPGFVGIEPLLGSPFVVPSGVAEPQAMAKGRARIRWVRMTPYRPHGGIVVRKMLCAGRFLGGDQTCQIHLESRGFQTGFQIS